MDENSSSLPSSASSKILCRYFMNGVCRYEENCTFSHDRKDAPSIVCTYYQLGSCSYGNSCRYDHVKSNRSEKYNLNAKPSSSSTVAHLNILSPELKIANVDSNMVTLNKHSPQTSTTAFNVKGLPEKLSAEDWVKASEFIPGKTWKAITVPSSYLEAAQTGVISSSSLPKGTESVEDLTSSNGGRRSELCPYAAYGACNYGNSCPYRHGDICDMCGKAVLLPDNTEQQEEHKKECLKEHERNMEVAFASQLSEEKVCGVCMEVVWEKFPPTSQRFGILSDCSHIFCLNCIRKWRAEDHYDNQVVKSCPECRMKSDFVIPSRYWVETKEEKVRLIDNYKLALSKKPCMHFKEGNGQCPFNDSCFYLHAFPDGSKPPPNPLRRRRLDADGKVDFVPENSLWEFLNAANETRSEFATFLMTDFNDDTLLDLAAFQIHELNTFSSI